MPSSNAYSTCRIDWRPSQMFLIALASLCVLATGSLWLSALPVPLAGMATLGLLGHGIWRHRHESTRPAFALAWNSSENTAELNFGRRSQSLSDVRVLQRGPLAALQGRDELGRRKRYVWWPDTLPAAARRQLRLAAVAARPARR